MGSKFQKKSNNSPFIGKEGKTIKNIRKILSIRATQENKAVAIDVVEKE